MTDEQFQKESSVIKDSQKAIQEECKKLGDSVTRVLMLGGPVVVDGILRSFLDTNGRIMKELKIEADITFEKTGGMGNETLR